MVKQIVCKVDKINYHFNKSLFMAFILLPAPHYVSVYYSDTREVIA